MDDEKSMFDYMDKCDDKGNRVWETISRVFWYRSLARIPDIFRQIKWFLQRVFRASHTSDLDIWDLRQHLSPIILRKLKAFRSYPLHGYPAKFCEYHENEWESREKYDEAFANGDVSGGGFDAWIKALDEMIFAFDFLVYYEYFDKERDAMLKRHNLEYPHKKIPENRRIHYAYKRPDGSYMSSHLPPDEAENKDNEFLGEEVSYYNFDLEREYYERVHNGLGLFAKHFMSLWD